MSLLGHDSKMPMPLTDGVFSFPEVSIAMPPGPSDSGATKVSPPPSRQSLDGSEYPGAGEDAVGTRQATLASAAAEFNQQTTVEPHHATGRVRIWGVPFDRVTMGQAIDRIAALIERRAPSYVITANLNYVMLQDRQPELRQVTEGAGLVLADGQPIVWRSRCCAHPLPERVAGSEMIYRLAERARDCGWRLYLLGGEPGVADRCAEKLVTLYPGLKIAGAESPPFRLLTPAEQQAQDRRIRDSRTDVLLVAFGQPKGEKWIHEVHQRLGVPVSIQIGASFDFVAGKATRAPRIWQRCGLEWAHRMCSDPKRLVPRYWANACFLARALFRDGLRRW